MSVSEFQRRLQQLAAKTGTSPAAIYVFARAEQLELILVPTAGEPMQYSVPGATAAQVRAQVRELQNEVVDPTRRRTTSYLSSAQQLDDWIMAPLQADLQRLGVDTLLFSLDEGLRSLPLAVLHDGEQFLLERYRFSVIPSLSLAKLNYTDVRNADVLAMGMSEFQYLNPLPAVPTELAAIAQQSPGRKAILNDGFTVANLKAQRQQTQAPVVHLATHAEFMPDEQGGSFIQFWEQSLAFEQMAGLDWSDPELALLVLSACRTALGDTTAEYGFAGLAVQSGVDTAIASLWYANDVGTLGLMSEFYHQLSRTPLKSEALRQAQIALLRGELRVEAGHVVGNFGSVDLPADLESINIETFQHPYYWSGFSAIGNPW
ncbi:MAG: CHAT domain-containing protein [Spirulinaceae cyanobacterium RM2_2_10]|nr:CHAT domain-containing protein [Spirulinaceae cyanobacterium RM2_2_10]